MAPIIIYVTCSDQDEAGCIAEALLERGLIACANIMAPHKAVYRWEGKTEHSDETAMILKTKNAHFDAVKDVIASMHSYDCPCIVSWPIEKGHEPFMTWIEDQTTG